MNIIEHNISKIICDKNVALIGNAKSLLQDNSIDIDKYNVVVRINRGPDVAKRTTSIGKRTDILLISGFESKIDEFILRFPLVVWMSPSKRDLLTAEQIERLLFYPLEWWEELHTEVGTRPSTGCMGIDLLTRLMGKGELHLYGFDFWRSPTSYNGINRPGPHLPSAEEAFARRRIPAVNIHGSWTSRRHADEKNS